LDDWTLLDWRAAVAQSGIDGFPQLVVIWRVRRISPRFGEPLTRVVSSLAASLKKAHPE
jgi:hypothetical protein